MDKTGIISVEDLAPEFNELRRGGTVRETFSTGFYGVDGIAKLAKGYCAVITGIPSMGKSEFVDAVAVNTAIQHGWKWAFFSPENYPIVEHFAKIAEKYTGKRIDNISPMDSLDALAFGKQYFTWMYPPDDRLGLKDILGYAEQIKKEKGLDALVIDPWNEVNHDQGPARDDQYLARALGLVRRFARKHDIFIAIVAHPNRTQKDDKQNWMPPGMYDLNGGAMWRNKVDYGFCVHRPSMNDHGAVVLVQKVKFKWMGIQGLASLDYDPTSGRFKDPDNPYFSLPAPLVSPF